MPWKPLPAVAFAIAIHPFRATHDSDLPLQIGDCLYIIEQGGSNGDWYRGYLVGFPSLLAGLTSEKGEQLDARVFTGIFPRNCVEVREVMEGENGNGNSSGKAPVIEHEREEKAADERTRRRSQAVYARRLSRALSRKRSAHDVSQRKAATKLVEEEPLPRDPNAPKPPAPVPTLRVGDETGLSAQEPLVDEIASCLREWHDARLHKILLARGYSQLGRVQELIKRLDRSRKQLLHDVMTAKELRTLREDTVWDLVAGNKLLTPESQEVIVRSPTEKGRILTAEDSVIEMTKLQANMSILDRPPNPPVDRHMLYHILVDVRNLVADFDDGEPAAVQMYICARQALEKPLALSENYAISLPMPERPEMSEDQPKSLFINLSASDLGIGTEGKEVFVIFKVLKDEPVRTALTGSQGHLASMSLASLGSGSNKHGSMKGRRSVFGSQRRRDGHLRADSQARPSTALSSYSTDDRNNESQSEISSKDVKTVKRTVGIGATSITRLARSPGTEMERMITVWSPCPPGEDGTDDNQDWNDIIRDLMRSPTGSFAKVKAIKRMEVSAICFANPDLEALVRNTPTLLYDVFCTPKIGFSGAPPAGKRSDIYLTLSEPTIPGRHGQAHLSHSKFGNVPLSQRCTTPLANLQLTLEVRRADGARIEDCIFTAANHAGHTAWRTTGVERGEGWNQTIRLAIPAEDVPGCHIVMSIADAPNFPFALAWVPLWENEAFVRDGEHNVALYVYDEYSSSMIGGKGAYLALPPWATPRSEHAMATVRIGTFLCSTEYSQDPNLLGLLDWRSFYGKDLFSLLQRFCFVPEIEIVKLLSGVFTALFEILNEYARSESHEDLVFQDLVVVLGIARDRRFDLGDFITAYATTRRDWQYASRSLVRAYKRLLGGSMDAEKSRKLRAALKVGDLMLRLIIETTKYPDPDTEGTGLANGHRHETRHPDFKQDLQSLFVALMALMRNPMPILLGTQTLVVQHFHTWLPELTGLMSATEILEIATDLLDACTRAQGKMICYRLVLIVQLSGLEAFKDPEARTNLIANSLRWLAPYWGDPATCAGALNASGGVTQQYRDQVRLCCSVVAAQIEGLGEESCQYVPKMTESYLALQKYPAGKRKVFSMLFPSSYPFPTKPVPNGATLEVDEALLELSTLLSAALTTQTRLYFDASQIDITGVLMQCLKVGQSVLGCEAFPRSWLSLHASQHRFAMAALERISEALLDGVPSTADMEDAMEFDTEIWRAFFDTLFLAVSSPGLAMEAFPEQKRRAVWKIAGDVRELGAQLLRRTWSAIGWETDEESRNLHGFERLGGYQVQFVPELVAPVVELCLSVHAGLRKVAIEVLRTMIVSTWEIDQELGVIQTAIIDCLDHLCRTRSVTESYLQKTFVQEVLETFKPLEDSTEAELYQAVVEMFGKVEELLGMLATVHKNGGGANEATKIVDTLRLMEFLRDMQSEEAYIRYVHQLADLQVLSGNHTEAGLALQLHAERYAWEPATRVEQLKGPVYPAQTAFERKEALYFEMCQAFERGQSWMQALAAYKELATQYESNIFDFGKLARAQRAMASIYERIAKGERPNARYFRVVYKGLGFAPGVRDKEYIFEGHAAERLGNFEERLQQLHPAAQIVRSTADTEGEGQYLQIFPVSANKDINHMVYQRTKVTHAAREYALLSNPNRFAQTTRSMAVNVPVTEQTVEKVIYTTADSFPNLLRQSEVVSTQKTTLEPIEAAIERTTRKTQELLSTERRISTGEDEGAMSQLSDMIILSVDPTSDSSVARYRALFPASEVPDSASAELSTEDLLDKPASEPALTPMQNALKIALLDHALAIRRCLSLYTRPAFLATRAEIIPRFEATFAPEIAVLWPNHGEGWLTEPTPREDQDEDLRAVSRQANAGAAPAEAATDGNITEDENESRPRQSRRRSSLGWLGRRGSSANRDSKGDGMGRSGSRLRDPSLPRRLSFFKASEDKLRERAEADREREGENRSGERMGGNVTTRAGSTTGASAAAWGEGLGQVKDYSSMSTAQLKKRLSFLRSQNEGVGKENEVPA